MGSEFTSPSKAVRASSTYLPMLSGLRGLPGFWASRALKTFWASTALRASRTPRALAYRVSWAPRVIKVRRPSKVFYSYISMDSQGS